MSGENFPQRLQQLRKEKNLSQLELAGLCGLGQKSIGRYERSEAEPHLNTLILLAGFFDVSLDYLTGMSEKK